LVLVVLDIYPYTRKLSMILIN